MKKDPGSLDCAHLTLQVMLSGGAERDPFSPNPFLQSIVTIAQKDRAQVGVVPSAAALTVLTIAFVCSVRLLYLLDGHQCLPACALNLCFSP